jgi:hypothetical protein
MSNFFVERDHATAKRGELAPLSGASAVLQRIRDAVVQREHDRASAEQNETSLSELLRLSSTADSEISRVKKKNVFEDELTDSEQAIVAARVQQQQQRFAAFKIRQQRKQMSRISSLCGFLSGAEIKAALERCNGNEEEVVGRVTGPDRLHFLLSIRKRLATKHVRWAGDIPYPADGVPQNRARRSWVTGPANRAAVFNKSFSTSSSSSTTTAKADGRGRPRLNSEERAQRAERAAAARRSRAAGGGTKRDRSTSGRAGPRLKLDDALANADSMEGWSEARKRAFAQIESNPNAYYYRFNAPGEKQVNGTWNDVERVLFFERMKTFPVNQQWGIFSMTIPGRVGYQCSNYYRRLVETGELHDPNYELDEKGKAHYKFKSKNGEPRRRRTPPSSSSSAPSAAASSDAPSSGDQATPEASASTQSSVQVPDTAKTGTPTRASTTVNNSKRNSKRKPAAAKRARRPRTTKSLAPVLAAGPRPPSKSRKRSTRAALDDSDDESDSDNGSNEAPARKRRRGGTRRKDDGDSSEEECYRPQPRNLRMSRRQAQRAAEAAVEAALLVGGQVRSDNPLPGIVDPITLDELVEPAISPYGHVMSKESWLRCLRRDPPNICPLSKKPLTIRQLTLLTWDNIEQYRSQIRN